MVTVNNIGEDIHQQIEIGFGKKEIIENLRAKGYSDPEIKEGLTGINFAAAVAQSNGGSVSTKSILFGILFLIVAVVRLSRYADGGSIFLGLGVITAIAMGIYFFTKRS